MHSWGFGPAKALPCSGGQRSPHLGALGAGILVALGVRGAGLAWAGNAQVPGMLDPGLESPSGADAGAGHGLQTGKRCTHLQAAAPGSCRPRDQSEAGGQRKQSETHSAFLFANP